MRCTFKKQEKLKKSKLISRLFIDGKSLTVFPIKLVYLETKHQSPYKIQAGVSASKRNFKKAVDRIRIKRLLREAYRKNKHSIYNSEQINKHILMFIYLGSKELEYEEIEDKMQKIIHKFIKKQTL